MAADAKMMAPYMVRTRFEVSGSLPALDGDAQAWVIRQSDIATDDLDRLASALGIDGEFTETVEGAGTEYEYSWWQIGSGDGTAPSLNVQNDAPKSWWYSRGYDQNLSVATSCDPSADADAICEIPPMDPPAGVPSAEEAERLFGELLNGLGIDPAAVVVEVWADDWSASVTGWVVLDGIRSSLVVSASYGENGTLSYASGYLSEPEKFATYPRIGTAAALEALQAQYDSWIENPVAIEPLIDGAAEPTDANVGLEVVGEPEIAPVPETAVESLPVESLPVESLPVESLPVESLPVDAVPGDSGSDAIVPVDTTPVDTTPVDTTPVEVEEMVVTIIGVEEDLQMMYGAENEVYLIPAYAFLAETDEYGYQPRYTYSAVSDEYVVPTAGISPMPGWLSSARSSSESGASEVAVDPSTMEILESDLDALVGLSEAEATDVATAQGWEVRVVSRDGEDFAVTKDFRSDRVNLTLVDDVVTGADIG